MSKLFFRLIRHYLGRRFIAGASYADLEILSRNILCYISRAFIFRKHFCIKTYANLGLCNVTHRK